jgi:di/tricarboxylate transporter
MPSIAGVSAFVNNTPLVAIMMPYVYQWAKRKNISPSKVLIPLSYAAILGGTITLVGTSTNLVVNGFVVDSGLPPLELFDFSPVGIPIAVIGILFLYFAGPSLLPARKDALADFTEKSREYVIETQVAEKSGFIGKTVEEAGLRNLRGLFLVEILRGETVIAPVNPKEVIEKDDVLIFAGATETIIDLVQSQRDLTLPRYTRPPRQEKLEIVEVVVSSNSSLIGKIVKQTNFRGKYDAAIVAVNRNGEKLSGKIGQIEIRTGDLLLLIAGKDFGFRSEESHDFYTISKLRSIVRTPPLKAAVLVGGIVAAFILSAFDILSLFIGLLILLCVIAALSIVRLGEIKRSLDIELFTILALSIAIGKAISKSGADVLFANSIISFFHQFGGTISILLGVYLVTNILAMLVTNKAAVAITFPIAVATAAKLGIDPKPFILAVAFAGCAEFMTPYGYQTNLMIYGPGGYKFKDYIRVGWGLSLLFMIACVGVLGYVYHLY